SEMDDVREELTDSQGTLDTSVKEVAAQAGELEGDVAGRMQTMDEARGKLKSKMEEYQGFVESRVEDAGTRLEKLAGTAANDRREALESLAGKSTALWDAGKERGEDG